MFMFKSNRLSGNRNWFVCIQSVCLWRMLFSPSKNSTQSWVAAVSGKHIWIFNWSNWRKVCLFYFILYVVYLFYSLYTNNILVEFRSRKINNLLKWAWKMTIVKLIRIRIIYIISLLLYIIIMCVTASFINL